MTSLIPISYDLDGVSAIGYFACQESDQPIPGILIAHEAPGMSALVKNRAVQLAKLGYAAFALDMYGGENVPLEEATKHHQTLMNTPGVMRSRARVALEILASQQNVDAAKIACIGFCQGGITAMELARDGAPIQAAVGFHPGLKRPAGSECGPISAKVLMMIGDCDPLAPPEDQAAFRQEMASSGADWQLHIFGGVEHSYTNPEADQYGLPGLAYNEAADRRSWAMMLTLFDEIF